MLILWRLGLACFTVMLLAISLASAASTRFPARQLAYESRLSRQNYDLFLLDLRTRITVPLTRTPYGERHPAWSPDGSTLAYTSNEGGAWEIYIIPVDGSGGEPQQVTHDNARAMQPDWSPDGRTIAYDSTRNGNLELYTLRLDDLTATPQRLTNAPGSDEEPVWSPDGSQIAFSSYREGDKEVHILNLSNGETQNITQNFMDGEWNADWSPDGETLTFTSNRTLYNWQIYRFNPATPNNLIQMTDIPLDVAGAVWHPDGEWLAVEVYDTLQGRSLYLLPADAEMAGQRALRRLTVTRGDDRYPAWRP